MYCHLSIHRPVPGARDALVASMHRFGAALEGAVLLALFSLSQTLEHRAMGKARRAVEALMQLRPDQLAAQLAKGLRTALDATGATAPISLLNGTRDWYAAYADHLVGVQHVLVMAATPISSVFLISGALKLGPELTAQLLAATLVFSGIGSILQRRAG